MIIKAPTARLVTLLLIFTVHSHPANSTPVQQQDINTNTDLTVGFMTNYNYREFNEDSKNKLGDFGLALIRMGIETRHKDFILSARYHWYNSFNAVHHAWVGYNTSSTLQIQAGIIKVPFGLSPYAAHTFWLSVPYYVGHDDDHDTGVKLLFKKHDLDIQFSVIKNEELGNSNSTSRYSTDIISDADSNQFNQEVNQLNFRASYKKQHQANFKTEIGMSAEWGQLYNTNLKSFGDHWAGAFHINSVFHHWHFQFEAFKYQYNPENPDTTSTDTVLMGMLGAKAEVASEGVVYVANVARDISLNWGPVKKLKCYNDFSSLKKAKNEFNDSKLNVTGCMLKTGPTLIFIDFMSGKNMTFFGDNTGMGSGGDNQWKHRFNVRLGYFFK